MDENFNNDTNNNQQDMSGDNRQNAGNAGNQGNNAQNNNPINNVRSFLMDNKGNIRNNAGGAGGTAAALGVTSRTLTIAGWVCAALALIWSPYFAIAGVVLGIIANRQARGSGTGVILGNIAFAILNVIFRFAFGLFFIGMFRRAIMGY